jgi:hypothetical protein
MWYQAGADVVVVVHLLFIGFVVGGVFLAWRWPRIVWAHIPAAVYGALVAVIGYRGFARRHPLQHRYSGAVAGPVVDTVVDTRHDRLPGAGPG